MNSRLFTSPGGRPSSSSSSTVKACILVPEVHGLDVVLVLENQIFLSTECAKHLGGKVSDSCVFSEMSTIFKILVLRFLGIEYKSKLHDPALSINTIKDFYGALVLLGTT